MKASVFIACSLDGYIARPDGALDWLPSGEEKSGEDYGYRAFMDSVDVLVMGRISFEKVLGFEKGPMGRNRSSSSAARPCRFPKIFQERSLP